MNISPEMKVELESRAKQTKDRHEYARLCVILARSEGMSIELIAQAHRISRDSVYRYLAEYETEKKTQHDDRGGSPSKLSEAQTRELVEHLRGTTYLYAKHICNYVRATYGVDYTISGMTFWLKTQGFVYKEPIKVPGKLDPEKQEAFIRTSLKSHGKVGRFLSGWSGSSGPVFFTNCAGQVKRLLLTPVG